MTSEDWDKALPKRAVIAKAVGEKLGACFVEGVAPKEVVDSMVDLILDVAQDHYARGMRGVQQAIVRDLDLLHLLGPR